VIRVEDGYIVFIATERDGGTFAEARPVSLGSAQSNRVIIDSGVKATDRVVVVGQNRLANGDKVQIVESTARGAE
jgi:multidrug efflux pump subunit AcrA (membrane-fusion protein)